MAYAAAAGEAMEDSDEDIFSVQLPESPESFDERITCTSSNWTDLHAAASTSVNRTTCVPSMKANEERTAKKGSKAKEEQKCPANKGERTSINSVHP